MKKIIILLCLMSVLTANAQIDSIVNQLPRPNAAWETRYQQRLNEMWGTRIPSYTINPGNGSEDGGKSEWPKFLAKLAWPTTNSSTTTMSSFITIGRNMVNGSYVGSFYKPFSCAGYAMYYFRWKDSIAKYDPTQIDLIYSDVNNMWNYLIRQDHVFDACCSYNLYGGKEFNSENFHWMMRSAGYLFAHELHNKNIGGTTYSMENRTVSSILLHTGLASPITKTINPTVNLIDYFDGFLKNVTRALYSAGRVEWNSNNYYGHTMNPLLTIYEGADKCNDPNGAENKKRAQACIDWMVVEAALRYQDGFQAAADARAKTASYKPFAGSVYDYAIPYFADDDNYPTFGKGIWATKTPSESEIGFILSSSYRPPSIAIDIANREFPLPVEVQSAKPFYHIDHGIYFDNNGNVTGEKPYNAWNGTGKGRRFEFETIWLDKNVTMASAAVGRPDGGQGTYSEQCMWRIAAKGQSYGARMLSGNAGSMGTSAGRSPQHEIGQYRNMMMQMIKHSTASYNKIWIAIPDSLAELASTGESTFFHNTQRYKWNGNDLYLDLGNQVYIAIKPFTGSTLTVNTSFLENSDHSSVSYSWPSNTLGCVVTEVGTANQYSSFTDFYNATSGLTITKLDDSTYAYTGGIGFTIKMRYTPTTTFMMTTYTDDTPYTNPINPAGNYPKVWGDNNYIDFKTWDSYKTVYGWDLINQPWGGCELTLKTSISSSQTTIDPLTAEVTFKVNKSLNIPTECNEIKALDNPIVYPNPSTDGNVNIKANIGDQALLFNSMGTMIENFVISSNLSSLQLNSGIYILRIKSKNEGKNFKVIVK